jgi:hypothetical protein
LAKPSANFAKYFRRPLTKFGSKVKKILKLNLLVLAELHIILSHSRMTNIAFTFSVQLNYCDFFPKDFKPILIYVSEAGGCLGGHSVVVFRLCMQILD